MDDKKEALSNLGSWEMKLYLTYIYIVEKRSWV